MPRHVSTSTGSWCVTIFPTWMRKSVIREPVFTKWSQISAGEEAQMQNIVTSTFKCAAYCIETYSGSLGRSDKIILCNIQHGKWNGPRSQSDGSGARQDHLGWKPLEQGGMWRNTPRASVECDEYNDERSSVALSLPHWTFNAQWSSTASSVTNRLVHCL